MTINLNVKKRYVLILMCFIASFVCYIDRVNISVAIIAMQEQFQWTETTKGFILSSFYIGYMLMQVPVGWLTNKFGGKLVLGFALVWWSIMTILTPIASLTSLGLLISVRILMGAGETGTFPGSYNLFSRWVPKHERSRAVAFLVSGIPLGTLFALLTTGWLVENYGWPSVFYIFGGVGVFFTYFWYWYVHNTPENHPTISDLELNELKSINFSTTEKRIPWKKLLCNSSVIALMINHFCSNWGFYVLLSWLPSYFKVVQGVNITSAGIMSAAPWLTMFAMSNLVAWFADRYISKGGNLTFVRKFCQLVGLVGSALFLFLTKDAVNPNQALLLLCLAMGFLAFTFSGFLPNHLDIAPQYAGVLLSITNTAGTLPGVIGVFVTGYIIDMTGSYNAIFILAAAINIIGAAIWFIYGNTRRIDC